MPLLHAAIDDRHALIRETLEMIFGKGPEADASGVVAEPEKPKQIAVETVQGLFRMLAG